ncbi:hypothetical protein OHA72_10165 [Dactylosporangium sp. NBC_01737]|uniref:hypothetical protein n=1 Tax=Dactylosporangium sp. NBC_01737 TaxID=2975959 RepID=UPI002E13357A|nr:hypothetical protein OHA72_10165 [Dactylosporangium sp. NBC_01737]
MAQTGEPGAEEMVDRFATGPDDDLVATANICAALSLDMRVERGRDQVVEQLPIGRLWAAMHEDDRT